MAAAVLVLVGTPLHAEGPTIDASAFAKLRSDYAAQPSYDPFFIARDERKALSDANKAGDDERIVALAVPWLEKCPVDAEAHIILGLALNRLGRHEEAFAHLYAHHGLVQSVLETGTGESKEAAFEVIAAAEEYDVLRTLRAEPVVRKVDPPHIVWTVKIGGQEKAVYFDASTALEATRRLGEHDAEPEADDGGRRHVPPPRPPPGP